MIQAMPAQAITCSTLNADTECLPRIFADENDMHGIRRSGNESEDVAFVEMSNAFDRDR